MFRRDLTMVLGVSFFFAFILLPFQNCSKVAYRDSNGSRGPASTTKDLQMGGNGTGYDGKVYVSRGVCGEEEKAIKSMLAVSSDGQQAYLLREDCLRIDPRPVAVEEIQIASATADTLVLNGNSYVSKEVDRTLSHSGELEGDRQPSSEIKRPYKNYRPVRSTVKQISKKSSHSKKR